MNKDDTRFRILNALAQTRDVTQREILSRRGLSFSAVNYVLKALVEKGLVKVKNFTASKNKFGYVYRLTQSGIAEKPRLTGASIQRKLAERQWIEAEIDEVLAAREAHTFRTETDADTARPGEVPAPTIARPWTWMTLELASRETEQVPILGFGGRRDGPFFRIDQIRKI